MSMDDVFHADQAMLGILVSVYFDQKEVIAFLRATIDLNKNEHRVKLYTCVYKIHEETGDDQLFRLLGKSFGGRWFLLRRLVSSFKDERPPKLDFLYKIYDECCVLKPRTYALEYFFKRSLRNSSLSHSWNKFCSDILTMLIDLSYDTDKLRSMYKKLVRTIIKTGRHLEFLYPVFLASLDYLEDDFPEVQMLLKDRLDQIPICILPKLNYSKTFVAGFRLPERIQEVELCYQFLEHYKADETLQAYAREKSNQAKEVIKHHQSFQKSMAELIKGLS